MFKISLWVITFIGLAPACLLAAYALYVNVSTLVASRNATPPTNLEETSTVADTPIARRLWPAALVLAGAGCLAAGLLFMFDKQAQTRAGNIKDLPIIVASLADHQQNRAPDFIGVSVGDEGPFFILHGGENVMVSFPLQDLPKEQFAQIKEIAFTRNGAVIEHEIYPEGGGIQIYTFDQIPYATDFCVDVLREGFHVEDSTRIMYTTN